MYWRCRQQIELAWLDYNRLLQLLLYFTLAEVFNYKSYKVESLAAQRSAAKVTIQQVADDHCVPYGVCESTICLVGILKSSNSVIRTCGAEMIGCRKNVGSKASTPPIQNRYFMCMYEIAFYAIALPTYY
ncbi:hypothetical protein DINM_021039 [Dirofilaria immitis]|nr:hypothetical protein [Dirofilaria immitis]